MNEKAIRRGTWVVVVHKSKVERVTVRVLVRVGQRDSLSVGQEGPTQGCLGRRFEGQVKGETGGSGFLRSEKDVNNGHKRKW